MLNESEVAQLVNDEMIPRLDKQRQDVEKIDKWYRGQNEEPWMPRQADPEYRALAKLAPSRWLSLVVTMLVQALYVEDFQSSDGVTSPAWQIWQANGMDSRQIALHRAAVAHGQSYGTVTPGDMGPKMRGHSMRQMVTMWDDAAEDEFPQYAMRRRGNRIRFYDDAAIWDLRLAEAQAGETAKATILGEPIEHPAKVCPVVRFANTIDLDGRCDSEIENLIPLAARIDHDTFDRLLVQHFQAFQVRVLTGLVKPDDADEAAAEKLRLKHEDLLVLESPDSSASVLPAASMSGHTETRDSDIRDLAAAGQVPAHHLLGSLVNLSAEALAAAESGHQRKVTERKHTLGESHEQFLRLAATMAGDVETANDFTAEVRWADMESRSLSQVADALGKLSTMLGVPAQVLWDRIPGWTAQDTTKAKQLLDDGDALSRMMDEFASQTGAADGVAA